MSRAYRVRVSESLSKVIRAEDHIKTQLELLDILPKEQMAALLTDDLKSRGFEERDGKLVRESDGVLVEVDPTTAEVTVSAASDGALQLETEKEGHAWDDFGDSREQVEQKLKNQAKQDLEAEADQQQQQLQKEVTDKLEGVLADVRSELDKSANRVTAEALKRKARSMGHIKELTEDPENGEMTIVLEV